MKYFLVILISFFVLLLGQISKQIQENEAEINLQMILVKVDLQSDSLIEFEFSGDYTISAHEITQSQYKLIMGTNPSKFKGDNLPVESITWFDAVMFCNKLSEKFGLEKCYDIIELKSIDTDDSLKLKLTPKFNVSYNFNKNGYRLPNVAEWDFAANGGQKNSSFKYSGSDDIEKIAWHMKNSMNITHQVGTKQPNALGIFDMTGNVAEWCNDLLKDYLSIYPRLKKSNNFTKYPKGSKALKGGSWCNGIDILKISEINFAYPTFYRSDWGFRIVRASN